MNKNYPKIVRGSNLAGKIIFVDGLAGCGKTMFSSIISSLNNVEIMNYSFEIEFLCRLNSINKLSEDAAISMVKNLTDFRLYENMMGRNVNFRYSDLSSVFNTNNPLRYFKRIFQKGDSAIPKEIKIRRPILNLTTHDLLQVGKPVFLGLEDRIAFIDVIRHPLLMIIQQTLNMENIINNSRDINIYFEHKGKELPFFALGWEDLFLKSNPVEKAIYYMKYENENREKFKSENLNLISGRILTIPFENFVKHPEIYMKKLLILIDSKYTKKTKKTLIKQKVPRKNVIDGIPLSIYKRCGWQPPREGISEKEEILLRREFALKQGASENAMETLDNICAQYEKENQIKFSI